MKKLDYNEDYDNDEDLARLMKGNPVYIGAHGGLNGRSFSCLGNLIKLREILVIEISISDMNDPTNPPYMEAMFRQKFETMELARKHAEFLMENLWAAMLLCTKP